MGTAAAGLGPFYLPIPPEHKEVQLRFWHFWCLRWTSGEERSQRRGCAPRPRAQPLQLQVLPSPTATQRPPSSYSLERNIKGERQASGSVLGALHEMQGEVRDWRGPKESGGSGGRWAAEEQPAQIDH